MYPSNNELLIMTVQAHLGDLTKYMEQCSGVWDGDNSGKLEDMASLAQEIIDTTNTLQGFLTEWEEGDYDPL